MPVFLERFVLPVLAGIILAQFPNAFGLPVVWRIVLGVGAFILAVPVAFSAYYLSRRAAGSGQTGIWTMQNFVVTSMSQARRNPGVVCRRALPLLTRPCGRRWRS
jgi:uncharacterized membrane protein